MIEAVASQEGKNTHSKRRVTRSQTSIQPVIIRQSATSLSKIQKAIEDKSYWEVKKLLGRRLSTDINLFEYLVEWKGWSHDYDEWVSISSLNCDDLIKEFELTHVGDDGLEAAMIACGFVAPTADKVIRYRDTYYFLVPYGQGNITTFCIVGPDKERIELKCLNSSNVIHHKQHAKLVAQSITKEGSPFAPLSIDQILLNKDKHKHTISAGNIGSTFV